MPEDDSCFTSCDAREMSPLSTGGLSGPRARCVRMLHQVLDTEFRQRCRERAFGLRHGGKHDAVENVRTWRRVVMLHRAGGAQDVGDADALVLARERVAATR